MVELEKLPSQNVQTYSGFRKAIMIALLVTAVVLIAMALFLA